MPLWAYGYLAISCLFGLWHGASTIRQQHSSTFRKLKPRQAIVIGWLEIVANVVVLTLVMAGVALHVTYP